jgi:glycosyltransferase involved in cell wall biosynthesis
MRVNINCPVNPVSFGNVSFNLISELLNKNIDLSYFPIGNVNLNSFDLTEKQKDFFSSEFINLNNYSRHNVSIKLWHISGLLENFSDKRVAITFHETSKLTEYEKVVLENQDAVIVTSSYTKDVFEEAGLKNVFYIPLGFDSQHFSEILVPKIDATTFGVFGKMESRKNTLRIIKNWCEIFGGNKKYRLNCCISNPFLKPEVQKQMILSEIKDIPWNVNFINYQEKLKDYSLILNSIDIDLTAMSSCEGFNLPAFQSLCLGKISVMLNAHVHKDYKNESCVLVEPTGFRKAVDNIFFKEGEKINQGEWFDFSDTDLKAAMLEAVNLHKNKTQDELRANGEKLRSNFTYEKFASSVLDVCGKFI